MRVIRCASEGSSDNSLAEKVGRCREGNRRPSLGLMACLGVPVGGRVRRLDFLSILRGGFLLSRVGGIILGSLIDTRSEADDNAGKSGIKV